MLIYIAGAGAMGCRFGYQLSKTEHEVIFLDHWEDHIQAIQQAGLKVTGDVEDTLEVPIMHPADATRHADLVILLTKAMQLPQMLQDIQSVIGEDTKVLCLLNGLGHADVIRQYVPFENILLGVTVWTAQIIGAGVVKCQGVGTINLQSLDPRGEAVARHIVAVLNSAGLNATYDTHVTPAIWRKACVNGTMNSLCALLDCTIGELFASPYAISLVHNIIHEFVMVAHAEGVELDEAEIIDYVMQVSVKAAHHYPSMHQDLVQNNRPTEIDFLNGAVAEKAEHYGIATPVCRTITQMIRTKESVLNIR